MTGFARSEGHGRGRAWTWELRSVNGKGRDMRCRLAPGFEGLDAVVRERIAARLKRGNITVGLTVAQETDIQPVRINHAVLDEFVAASANLCLRVPGLRPASANGLLALKGVIEQVGEETVDVDERDALQGAILADFDVALEALFASRSGEGEKLSQVLGEQVDGIEAIARLAKGHADNRPDAIRARLKEQVQALLDEVPAMPGDRLAQEAALLMTKADVREELDRLGAHVAAARELLAGGGAVGRKLDFLCQEFNREANTVCSKSSDVELTRIGLDLKALIEQFREQVQNIE